ncbi:MAG: chemotaxis protein CheW [Promethearchaeota archaeon]
MAQLYGDSIKLIVFELASEEFAIEITKINSIIRMENITEIPSSANFIEGVINYRGQPIVIVDLRKRFGLPQNSDKIENMRIIVLNFQPYLIGMIVDNVTEVLNLPFTLIEPVPENLITMEIEQEFLLGVGNINKGERLVILLDLAKVFSDDELEQLGVLFNDEQKIKLYLALAKKEKTKQELSSKLSSAGMNQALEERAMTLNNNSKQSQVQTRAQTEDMERAMIRKLALRDIQEELGISISDMGLSEESIILEDGQTIQEEDGVEYVYTDEDGNELSPEEIAQIKAESAESLEPSESTESSKSYGLSDQDISEMIAMAENENTTAQPGTEDYKSEPEADKNVSNDDVAAIIASVQAKKRREQSGSNEPKDSGVSSKVNQEINSKQMKKFNGFLQMQTKSQLVELAKSYGDLKLSSKLKKKDMIHKISTYVKKNRPDIILNH